MKKSSLTGLGLTVVTRAAVVFVVLGLAGCNVTQTAPVVMQGSAVRGSVHGGQQPVVGATIQLYAASTNGYGAPYTYSSGTSLLGTKLVTTDANGGFSVTGDYTCPSAITPIYLVATGGNPGLANGTNNSAIALMTTLGPCAAQQQAIVNINEVTTVASIWSLAPFMSSPTSVGTSPASTVGGGNLQGLVNAFASVNKVANISTGAVGGPALPVGATLPVAKINTIADIIAACVNTAGPATPGDACNTLFKATTFNSVVPTDTITAALAMAKNPTAAFSSLMSLVTSDGPFQPTLSSVPQDFYIVLHYTGGGLAAPSGIAADPTGNIWVTNSTGNSLTTIDAAGASATDASGYLSGTGGYASSSLTAPSAIAMDLNGNAWVTSSGSYGLLEISPTGSVVSSYLASSGNFSQPAGVAIDSAGTIWVTNQGNSSLTQISPGASPKSFTSATGLSSPTAIAIQPH